MREEERAGIPRLAKGEREQLVNYVLSLRKDRVQGLLGRYELPRRTGTRAQLRQRLTEALEHQELTVSQVVDHLDETEPYVNQHVFLYKVPPELADAWRDPSRVRARLRSADVGDRLNSTLPLALPSEPTVSAIRVGDGTVEIVAVEKREYTERDVSLDREEARAGEIVEYRAFVRRVSRGLIRLNWNVSKHLAELHVTQGHRGYDYEDATDRFGELVSGFLAFDRFDRQALRRAVVKLHELELTKSPWTRSQRLGLESKGGREVDVTSPTTAGGVVGEKEIDDAVAQITKTGRGRLGNVYWLADASNGVGQELHTMIIAAEGRIHFMRPMTEGEMSYVLRQVRSLL